MTRVVAFIGGFAAAGILFWAIGFAGRTAALFSNTDLVGALATAAYLLTAQAVMNAIAYAGVNAVLAPRAAATRKRVMALDAGAGAVASVMGWTGLTYVLLAPLTFMVGLAVSQWIAFVLPGLLTGVIAAFAAR